MAEIETLKKGTRTIYPQTHINAVVDDNGNTISELLENVEKKMPTKVSQLENDSKYLTAVPSTYATKQDVADAIAQSITTTLNTEV